MMENYLECHPLDVKEKIPMPSERQIRRTPSISNIATLDAALSVTRLAIIADHPSIQEIMDMIEGDEKPPSHLFIAHNIIDNIDRLRLTIRVYIERAELHANRTANAALPF
jgi:hypothetical protein